MHAIKKGQTLRIISPHHFERASRIGSCVACHHAAKAIGKLGLQFLEACILALCTNP